MTFESEGLLIVAIYIWLPPASYVVFSDNSGLHMVAAGELCCLSDNSGYTSKAGFKYFSVFFNALCFIYTKKDNSKILTLEISRVISLDSSN